MDPRTRRYIHLLENAACSNEDPILFDAASVEDAYAALVICGRCPVTDLCEKELQPREHSYDGVVGGVVYRNGKPLTLRKARQRAWHSRK